MNDSNSGFGTKAIHEGSMDLKQYSPLATPIFQTSTFAFESCEQGANRFAGEEDGYIYTRVGNPTQRVLEKRLAILEHGEDAVVTASGMGAISAVLWTFLKTGDHIIAGGVLYGCTFALLGEEMQRHGIQVSFVDTRSIDDVERAIKPNTKLIYLETPANPTLAISDIKKICDMAHCQTSKIMVVCDNTFATPYNQTPLDLGCDIVVHSVTKYLNGHGDVIAGAVIGDKNAIEEVKYRGVKLLTGSVISPFDSYLVLRGLKTLEIRMQRHNNSAVSIADFLRVHSKIETVNYPGLSDFPGHGIAVRQMRNGFGGMISFEVVGGRVAGAKLLNNLKLCTIAVSLGDAETLVEHPASMTHAPYTTEELARFNISGGLVRLSVGLEDPKDIINDLEHGLKKL